MRTQVTPITLRDYQTEFVDACANSLRRFRRVVGVAPTASGKSVIIGAIVARYLAKNPEHRVLVLCHQGELLLQNEQKTLSFGIRSTAVYCSGTGRKETSGAVVFASRDSLRNRPYVCGYFHLVLVDEAHLVGSDEESGYQRIFAALSPQYIVGLTGTPWRTDNGLIYGKGKFWEACACRIQMETIRGAGFLVPYRKPPTVRTIIDTSGIKLRAGEFDNKELTKRSITDDTVAACLSEWWLHAQDRRTSLFFCCSRDHAAVVTRHLSAFTSAVAYLDGATSKGERETILRNARAGVYRAIVNVDVLTTGVDIPIIDCIVFLRATNSVSLFVQAAGRGLRLAPGKTDCLMVDCAGNFERFGQIEKPRLPKGKKKVDPEDLEAFLAEQGIALLKEEAPQKTCVACGVKTYAAATKCAECGHVFFNHSSYAMTDAELAEAGIYALHAITAEETKTRQGAPCVIVCYRTQCGKEFKEWLFHQNPGYPKWLAEQKIAALESGATHVQVLQQKEKKYPKLSPLKIQSSESSSPISLTWESWRGGRTRA
jgi:DNA repair protein RadD